MLGTSGVSHELSAKLLCLLEAISSTCIQNCPSELLERSGAHWCKECLHRWPIRDHRSPRVFDITRWNVRVYEQLLQNTKHAGDIRPQNRNAFVQNSRRREILL